MYQSVLTNRDLSIKEVEKSYLLNIINLSDRIEANEKYGLNKNVDKIKYIKLKRLFSILNTFDDETNKCCLNIKNKQKLLNKLQSFASSEINVEPIWNYSIPEACVIPQNLIIN